MQTNLMDVTSQPRATAYLQLREPRKPLPPQTTSFFAAAFDADAMMCILGTGVFWNEIGARPGEAFQLTIEWPAIGVTGRQARNAATAKLQQFNVCV